MRAHAHARCACCPDTAHSTPGTWPAREFRTVGPAPRVPRTPAGPGHPRGGIPRPGGAPGGPCWPGALDIENATHKPLYNPNFEHHVLKKNGVHTPIFMIVFVHTTNKDPNSSSTTLIANSFQFFGASQRRPQMHSAVVLRHLGRQSKVSPSTTYRFS